jgi:predicted nucleic acid-binding protein
MTRVYLGPTSLHALGNVGELDLLAHFDGRLVVSEAVADAVVTEPARTALSKFLDDADVSDAVPERAHERASETLGIDPDSPEAAMLAGVLAHADRTDRRAVAVVSEDRRVRRLARGLGGAVTSAVGVVVRAAIEDRYLSRAQAKRIVRRLDGEGVRMTGEMRERVVGEVGE